MSEFAFIQSYTIAEVSKLIDIPAGTIREWEKQLEGILNIPRDDKGNRYYTEVEIQSLRNIKAMRNKKLSMAVIRDLLEQAKNLSKEESGESNLPDLVRSKAVLTQSEANEIIKQQSEMIHVMVHTMNHMVGRFNKMESVILEIQESQNQIAAAQNVHSESLSEASRGLTNASESLTSLTESFKTNQEGIDELISISRLETQKRKKFLGLF